MKVYVISEDAWNEGQGVVFEDAFRMRSAMTPIDIPDGCQLAVARNEGDVMCSNAAACDSDCYHKHPHRFDMDLCDTALCHDTGVMVKCVPQLRVVQIVEVK